MELRSNDKPHDSESIGPTAAESLNDVTNKSSRFAILLVGFVACFVAVSIALDVLGRNGLIGAFTRDALELLCMSVLVFLLLFLTWQLPKSRATQFCLYLLLACALLQKVLGLTNEVSGLDHVPILGNDGLLHRTSRDALDSVAICAVFATVYCLVLSLEKSFAQLRVDADRMAKEIADRKQTEAALRKSEERFRSIFAQAGVAVGVIESQTGRFVHINNKYENLIGYSNEEITNKTWMEISYADDIQKNLDKTHDLAKGKISEFSLEKRLIHKDGSLIWISLTVSPIWDSGEKSNHHIVTVEDITERKLANEQLTSSEQRFRSVAESANDAIILADGLAQIISWNQAAQTIFGYSDEEVLGKSLETLIPERYREPHTKGLERYIQTGETRVIGQTVELEGLRKDGSEFPLELSLSTWKTVEGRFYCGTLRDVTERKQAEASLRRSEERFDLSFEASKDGLWDWNIQTGEVYFSPRWCETLGFEPNELEPHINSWKNLVHPDDMSRVWQKLKEHLDGITAVYECENRLRMKSGKYRWNLDRGKVVERDAQGNPLRMVGVDSDITERKQAEEALRESETKSRTLLEGSPVCNKIIDLDSKLQYMSAAGRNQLKISDIQPFYGCSFPPDLYPESIRKPVTECLERAKAGEVSNMECPVHDTEGRRVWYDTTFVPARDKEGRVEYVIVTSVNITERKTAEEALQNSNRHLEQTLAELQETQEQIIQQERLLALGEMAGGIAHELNNTLSPVLSYIEILLLDEKLATETHQHLEIAHIAALDAAAVVARLHAFYVPGNKDAARKNVRLAGLLRQIVERTRPKWKNEAQRTGRSIEVVLKLEDEITVLGNSVELREVFTNLILNAVDAIPADGRITLDLHHVAESAVVEVTDTGSGMSEEVAAHCYEPFFTTKATEGTGLGLSVCHGIIQCHGGHIEIDTLPGHGTTFRIFLPLALQTDVAEPQDRKVFLPTRRVLYIDDDSAVRDSMSMLLETLGQQVDVADGGAAGIEMFRSNNYDVVITDLSMPGIDGHQVTRSINSIRGSVPVIIVTGWASGDNRLRIDSPVAPDQVLAKPLTMAKLQGALEKAFAQSEPVSSG